MNYIFEIRIGYGLGLCCDIVMEPSQYIFKFRPSKSKSSSCVLDTLGELISSLLLVLIPTLQTSSTALQKQLPENITRALYNN